MGGRGGGAGRSVVTGKPRGAAARHGTSKAMTTLADLNRLWPADHNATPWVATPDGSWTRMAGAGVNPDNMLAPPKEGRRLTAPIA
jgi:hypothetical protein